MVKLGFDKEIFFLRLCGPGKIKYPLGLNLLSNTTYGAFDHLQSLSLSLLTSLTGPSHIFLGNLVQ